MRGTRDEEERDGRARRRGTRMGARSSARRGRPVRRAVRRRAGARAYAARAKHGLRRFRQASGLAVALAAVLLFVWEPAGPDDGGAAGVVAAQTAEPGQEPAEAPAEAVDVEDAAGVGAQPAEAAAPPRAAADPGLAVEEATGTIRELLGGFYGILPKLGIGLVFLVIAWLLTRLLRRLLARVFPEWERGLGAAAVAGLVIWGVAVVAAVAVVVGDARAVAGSVGILGLALSWALQGPIESFTGWLINSFRLYYRVGDRIAVGEAFGDVYRIDLLTTTIWEAGGAGKAVEAAQPTGALVTFPNSEILRANVINYSRDFPAVWDEVTVGVANESDLDYAASVCGDVAARVLGGTMPAAAADYRALLRRAGLPYDVAERPEVYVSAAESWTDLTVRYLVPVRERRRWASDLLRALVRELARPEHAGRIAAAYPRTRFEHAPFTGMGAAPRAAEEPAGSGPRDAAPDDER